MSTLLDYFMNKLKAIWSTQNYFGLTITSGRQLPPPEQDQVKVDRHLYLPGGQGRGSCAFRSVGDRVPTRPNTATVKILTIEKRIIFFVFIRLTKFRNGF